ncbi:hypothetical protein WA158_007206 [Blastocystis sp. Blastoise]
MKSYIYTIISIEESYWTVDLLSHLICIYISHPHADHYSFVTSLFRYTRLLPNHSIPLFLAPKDIVNYVNSVFNENGVTYISSILQSTNRPLSISALYYQEWEHLGQQPKIPTDIYMKEAMNYISVDILYSTHCRQAYHILLYTGNSLFVAYSGDTPLSPAFIDRSRRAYILIHECSFDDADVDHAHQKRHTSLSGLIDLFIPSEIQFLILTHISVRSVKLSSIPELIIPLSFSLLSYTSSKESNDQLPFININDISQTVSTSDVLMTRTVMKYRPYIGRISIAFDGMMFASQSCFPSLQTLFPALMKKT